MGLCRVWFARLVVVSGAVAGGVGACSAAEPEAGSASPVRTGQRFAQAATGTQAKDVAMGKAPQQDGTILPRSDGQANPAKPETAPQASGSGVQQPANVLRPTAPLKQDPAASGAKAATATPSTPNTTSDTPGRAIAAPKNGDVPAPRGAQAATGSSTPEPAAPKSSARRLAQPAEPAKSEAVRDLAAATKPKRRTAQARPAEPAKRAQRPARTKRFVFGPPRLPQLGFRQATASARPMGIVSVMAAPALWAPSPRLAPRPRQAPQARISWQ